MTDFMIRMPWPPTEARPNFIRSNHWSKYRGKIAKYRRDAWLASCEMNVHKLRWPKGDIELVYTFFAPKGCRWDRDAMSGAFKAGQDGLADAMKGVDDKRFNPKVRYEKSVNEGCVMVQIVTPCISGMPVVGSIS